MNRSLWRVLWLLSFVLLLPAALMTAPYLALGRLYDFGRKLARVWRYCALKKDGWYQVGPLMRNDGAGVRVRVRKRMVRR